MDIYTYCGEDYELIDEVDGVKFLLNYEGYQILVLDNSGNVSLTIDAIKDQEYVGIEINIPC
jgi:hypothetical protein